MLMALVVSLAVTAMAAPDNVPMMKGIPSRHVDQEDVVLSYEPYSHTWDEFKDIFNKNYQSVEEELKRFKIFMKNVKFIEEHNAQYARGDKSFYLGINQFADLESWEVRKYNGLRTMKPPFPHMCNSTFSSLGKTDLPQTVDWRQEGYVTPVKNQKRCGSCWAFSSAGALEGQHFKKTGVLRSLSEQQLVDCSHNYNKGCGGGLPDWAYQYIKEAGGIESESEYPYYAQEGICRFRLSEVVAKVTGCVDVGQSETALQEAVATVGPISVAIDASHYSFTYYRGGVYDEPHCSSILLDHAVLAVGYGDDLGSPYWLVKNSWGVGWGLNGYIMMSRNKNNQCGIATVPSYPLV